MRDKIYANGRKLPSSSLCCGWCLLATRVAVESCWAECNISFLFSLQLRKTRSIASNVGGHNRTSATWLTTSSIDKSSLSMRYPGSEWGVTWGNGAISQSGNGIPGGLIRGGALDCKFCIRWYGVHGVTSLSGRSKRRCFTKRGYRRVITTASSWICYKVTVLVGMPIKKNGPFPLS